MLCFLAARVENRAILLIWCNLISWLSWFLKRVYGYLNCYVKNKVLNKFQNQNNY